MSAPTTAKKVCAIPDCDAPHYARGWCHRHYQRWYAHGDPTATHKPGPAPGGSPVVLPGRWVFNPRKLIHEYQEPA